MAQQPMIIFDHIKKTVAAVPMGRAADGRLNEVLAAQREQIATSGRPAAA
jgi:hypothetical protein